MIPGTLLTEYQKAPLGIDSGQPRFSWLYDPGTGGKMHIAYQIQVASSLEQLTGHQPDLWDSGKTTSAHRLNIPYEGKPLSSGKRYFWRVRSWTDSATHPSGWSVPSWFEMGLLKETDWKAEWIGHPPQSPEAEHPEAAPLLRHTFTLKKTIKRARLYISGLGCYRLYLNGKRVADRELDPSHTDYEKRVLYTTYDVTDHLKEGANAAAVELGRGWYGMTTPSVWFWEKSPWHDDPKLLFQLEVEFVDGSSETIVSGENWRTMKGPRLADSLYAGETYDARRAHSGWEATDFDDSDWSRAALVKAPAGDLSSFFHEPIRIIETLHPVSLTRVAEGTYVFDLGVNITGWAALQVEGPRGTEVILTHGEKLNPDGSVNIEQRHIEADIQTDRYTLAGNGMEEWEAQFSYKGFQYVQITGFPGVPALDTIAARVVHTDVASVGEFSSANSLLNQIHANTRRALLNNLHEKPTDTPVFEKNGWTGDAQLTAVTAINNFYLPSYYTKWMRDFLDAQQESGELPAIVPTSGWSFEGADGWTAVQGPTPAWDAAFFEIPWAMYRYYGDIRILEELFDGMVSYLGYLSSHADNHIVRVGLGDWVPPNSPSRPREGPALTSTAYYYRFARTVSDIAQIIGRKQETVSFAELAGKIKAAFNEEFLDREANIYRTDQPTAYRQTSNVVPLAFGLVPEDRRAAVVANLVEHIRANDSHLDTGIIGTRFLLPVLSENGYADLAYTIATKTTFPSWGHWIEDGATSLYEMWELTARSRNHHMFGSVCEWFYEYLVGVQPLEPGYASIRIRPHIPEGLEYAQFRVETLSGSVFSRWELNGGSLVMEVEIPPATTGQIHVPTSDRHRVTSPDQAEFSGMVDGFAVYTVPAGRFRFTINK